WRGTDLAAEDRITLTPKAFAILQYLVEHPGRLVTHDEFLDVLWPKTHVHPEVLKSHIFEIRAVLGDDSKKPVFIETLPRRGYRFIAPVRDGAATSRALSPAPVSSRLVGRQRTLSELGECLRKMSRGERQIVFVAGEAGIGKTAVVDAFMRQATAGAPDIRIALVNVSRVTEARNPITRCWKRSPGSAVETMETPSSRSWRHKPPPGSSSFPPG